MATVVVSAYKGVIESVLAKLKELMTGDKCTHLIAGVSSKDIHFLRDELPAINALLKKLEDADELDLQAKNWRNQAREMAYDIEDCIDEFSNNVESVDAKASFLEKASHFLKTCRAHLETAWQIKELKSRLKEINERRKRYKVEDCISNTTSVIVDPRISAFYKEAANLVGIDSPKRELAKMVMDEGKHLKVMSIVGFGGLGKTTLASQVYREVGGQFNCNKAFVSVSQKPDMVRLLTSVLLQLKQHPPSHACGVQDLINILREYLLDKRYFIVVDDLWDVPSWNIVACAFPQNNHRSRVMITTRNGDVARACSSDHGCIHNMKPLKSSFSPPFCNIERLHPNLLIFSSFPRWIGHLRCLRELSLMVKQMHQEDFGIIGIKLTSLVQLKLRGRTHPNGKDHDRRLHGIQGKDAGMMKRVFQEVANALPTGPKIYVDIWPWSRPEEART
ncbi:hypothetical protein EJB05_10273 [Eragrostis curvula]|uniref:NB-ARC domain-containing protein n=1 Tax=Eragrostis curvula TaxID=38414 RepID=A0A5J9W8R0_9POAL|nr:hypothetical protein EJB05_10273 [Eragrostis curvula]